MLSRGCDKMDLQEFKKLSRVLLPNEADAFRNQYIQTFINTSKEHYHQYIENLQRYSDGICYIGYLWDCLIEPVVIDFPYVKSKSDLLNEVFVFWDNHSQDRIFIEDYWKFGKTSVLALDFNLLLGNLDYLPEDIYIFDNSLKWTLILTHEDVDGKRWCLKSGEI